jgi:hypothetical protein
MARKSRGKSLLKKKRTKKVYGRKSSKRTKSMNKKRVKKSRKRVRKSSKSMKRYKTRRVLRRKRVQKGGYGKCENPFKGKYVPYEPLADMRRGVLTRQMEAQQGGGSIWRNLGLTFPKDIYHDAKDFLTNTKNVYTGDRQDSTSNVMHQPIGNMNIKPVAPSDYSKSFINADRVVADKIKMMVD